MAHSLSVLAHEIPPLHVTRPTGQTRLEGQSEKSLRHAAYCERKAGALADWHWMYPSEQTTPSSHSASVLAHTPLLGQRIHPPEQGQSAILS